LWQSAAFLAESRAGPKEEDEEAEGFQNRRTCSSSNFCTLTTSPPTSLLIRLQEQSSRLIVIRKTQPLMQSPQQELQPLSLAALAPGTQEQKEG
jgi:hypothetical protein